MTPPTFISIDQNSHVLWDTVPKLQALARAGWTGVHCVEDVDVAFTRQGAVAPGHDLELAPERMYRSGNSDWGAALFYSEFLGRNAVNVRLLEPHTGLSTVALAKRLGCTVDELYERYAASDNWQLIGTSYAGDPQHHRVIGDLSVAETAPYVRLLLGQARDNLIETFPEPAAQERIRTWYAAETARLDACLGTHVGGTLVDVYAAWTRCHVPDAVRLSRTSEFFAGEAELPRHRLLPLFLQDYPRLAGLYNEAVRETDCGLKPLQIDKGELPFFAVWRRAAADPARSGRAAVEMVRTGLSLDGARLLAADRDWPLSGTPPGPPLAAMRDAGLVCVCGKALLLVLQARLMPGGAPLALPYNGSLYMPAAYRFEQKLRAAGLLPWPVQPVLRVRFNFLRQWNRCPTLIRLPAALRGAFSQDELPASRLAEELPTVLARAERELAEMQTREGRERLTAVLWPREAVRSAELDARRRELARTPEGRPAAAQLWDEKNAIDRELVRGLFERALQCFHLRNLDYWDSRGALLPWSLALGGPEFYERLLAEAEIGEETPG